MPFCSLAKLDRAEPKEHIMSKTTSIRSLAYSVMSCDALGSSWSPTKGHTFALVRAAPISVNQRCGLNLVPHDERVPADQTMKLPDPSFGDFDRLVGMTRRFYSHHIVRFKERCRRCCLRYPEVHTDESTS